MTKPTCKTCPFWFLDEGDSLVGQCRRHAPTPVSANNEHGRPSGDYNGVWPTTCDDEWCGEHPERQWPPLVLTRPEVI